MLVCVKETVKFGIQKRVQLFSSLLDPPSDTYYTLMMFGSFCRYIVLVTLCIHDIQHNFFPNNN